VPLEQLTDDENDRVVSLVKRMLNEGYSQGRLAAACGVSQAFVSQINTGQRKASLVFAERLAKLAGTTLARLLAGDQAQPQALTGARYAPLEAARAMGEAMGYDVLWVRSWTPGGNPHATYDAEELWFMMKADFLRDQPQKPKSKA